MRIGLTINVLAQYSESLVRIFIEKGVRGCISFVRETLTGPWLDINWVRARLKQTHQQGCKEILMFLPKPTTEKHINALVSALVDYFSLSDYGIIWNDGERSIPEIWMMHPSRRFTYFALLSLYDFATRYTRGKRVLDLGCGVGYGSYYLASRGAAHVIGIEIDDKSYNYACDRYRHDKVTFLKNNVELLAQNPKYVGKLDVIYCSNVMEHIPNYDGALVAVKKLLSPNGLYIQITPPSGQSKGNPFHVTNFTIPEWAEILNMFFPSQHYFAHIPLRSRNDTNNEFDFRFEQCGAKDMGSLKSISGIVLCQKK